MILSKVTKGKKNMQNSFDGLYLEEIWKENWLALLEHLLFIKMLSAKRSLGQENYSKRLDVLVRRERMFFTADLNVSLSKNLTWFSSIRRPKSLGDSSMVESQGPVGQGIHQIEVLLLCLQFQTGNHDNRWHWGM